VPWVAFGFPRRPARNLDPSRDSRLGRQRSQAAVMVGPKLRKWASGAENTIDLFEALTSVRSDGQFRCEIGVATAGSTIAPIVVLFQPSPKKNKAPPAPQWSTGWPAQNRQNQTTLTREGGNHLVSLTKSLCLNTLSKLLAPAHFRNLHHVTRQHCKNKKTNIPPP